MAYSIQDGRDNGLHIFQMTIDTPGIHYIIVTDSVTKNTYYSNPIIVENTNENIYWGDIHSHSFLSDSSGSVSHAYYYARYVAGLEFHALTDHGEIIPFVLEGLSNYKKATDIAYEPNEFVTFRGIEYTNHETGHFRASLMVIKWLVIFLPIPVALRMTYGKNSMISHPTLVTES
ncbi:MAG: hypothetical protein ACFFDT_14395 [Candidatus Hodarchaeota archaeon]